MTKRSILDKISKKTQRIAGIISAVTVIIGAVVGLCSWVSDNLSNKIAAQISDFKEEVQDVSNRQEQAITRVELMMLMDQDPSNIAAIEKMAKYYFRELNGDLYMTQKYSDWAKQHGGDITVVIGVD